MLESLSLKIDNFISFKDCAKFVFMSKFCCNIVFASAISSSLCFSISLKILLTAISSSLYFSISFKILLILFNAFKYLISFCDMLLFKNL